MDIPVSIDAYLAALEERLPEFTWNATTFGKGRPVFFSWTHRHAIYGPMETQRMLMRGGTFPSLPEALKAVQARYEGFDAEIRRERDRRSQEWERAKAALRQTAQAKLDERKREQRLSAEEVEGIRRDLDLDRNPPEGLSPFGKGIKG